MRRFVIIGATLAALAAMLLPGTASAAISEQDALDYTMAYAKRQCNNDSFCKKYWASQCLRHSGGVSCNAWNYQLHKGKRYSCRRTLLWKSRTKGYFLSKWRCNYPGWDWGRRGT